MKALTLVFFLSFSILSAQDKTRIYFTDLPAWTVEKKYFDGTSGSVEMRPHSSMVTDAMGHFVNKKECREFAMILGIEDADYAFIFVQPDSIYRPRSVQVIKLDGGQEVIYAGLASRFSNVVKDACNAVKEDRES